MSTGALCRVPPFSSFVTSGPMWTAAWRGMSFFPQTQVLKDFFDDRKLVDRTTTNIPARLPDQRLRIRGWGSSEGTFLLILLCESSCSIRAKPRGDKETKKNSKERHSWDRQC